jgi:Alcohol dehydrogenase GroES-like domain
VRFLTGLIRPRSAVLGTEFAGVVEAVGSGVTSFGAGDKVFGYNRARSAARSREFANKAFLAWLVDVLDAYIRGLQGNPSVADANIVACALRLPRVPGPPVTLLACESLEASVQVAP